MGYGLEECAAISDPRGFQQASEKQRAEPMNDSRHLNTSLSARTFHRKLSFSFKLPLSTATPLLFGRFVNALFIKSASQFLTMNVHSQTPRTALVAYPSGFMACCVRQHGCVDEAILCHSFGGEVTHASFGNLLNHFHVQPNEYISTLSHQDCFEMEILFLESRASPSTVCQAPYACTYPHRRGRRYGKYDHDEDNDDDITVEEQTLLILLDGSRQHRCFDGNKQILLY